MPTRQPTEQQKLLRAKFFIDGFNLYHSINAAERESPEIQFKWLNIPALCQAHLYLIDINARLKQVEYFTAFAEHLMGKEPEKISRHQLLVRALTAAKVKVHLGRFKKKDVFADDLRQWVKTHEEKETDVAISCRILSGFVRDEMDVAVLLTGDSDFIPLYREVTDLFPNKRMVFAFPYKRISKEIRQACGEGGYFSIRKDAYSKHQFPDQIKLPSGKEVSIPKKWKRS